MARLIALLWAVLVAWLGVTSPTSAAEPASTTVPATYTYNTHVYDSPVSDTASERGAPGRGLIGTTYDDDGPWAGGAAARSDALIARPSTTYDYLAPVVQIARLTATTGSHDGATDGGPSALQPSVGAAKTADDWPILSGIVRVAECARSSQRRLTTVTT